MARARETGEVMHEANREQMAALLRHLSELKALYEGRFAELRREQERKGEGT